jgi:hypothetical protein
MTVLTCIWAVVAILNGALVIAAVKDAEEKFHTRYPELEIPKTSKASRFSVLLRLTIWAIVPCIQLWTLWILLFQYTTILEETIYDTYLKAMEEKRNAQKNSDISDSNET